MIPLFLLLRRFWLYILIVSVVVTIAASVTTTTTTSTSKSTSAASSPSSALLLANELRLWIEAADGGHVDPRVGFSWNEDQQQQQGQWWFSATESFKTGEVVASMPSSHVLQQQSSSSSASVVVGEDDLSCDMVTVVARELDLGDASNFAPLLNHLKEVTLKQFPIPSLWSAPSRRLLDRLLRPDLDDNKSHSSALLLEDPSSVIPPKDLVHWISHDYLRGCQGSPRHIDAAALTITWGNEHDGRKMVPLLSLFRHRNGNFTNVDTVMSTADGSFHVVAIRDIAQGELLTVSHNHLCEGCSAGGGARRQGYGTAELFRDYGWIEDFPQQWHYMDHEIEFDLSQINGDTEYSLNFTIAWTPETVEEYGEMGTYLRRQVRRLLKWKNFWNTSSSSNNNNSITTKVGFEWQRMGDFVDANILAMTLAATSLDEGPSVWPIAEIDQLMRDMTHYHPLTWEYDDLDYKAETCNNDEIMNFHNHARIEAVTTPYQKMVWMINPSTGDIILELDRIVQIASIYRPQYHEYSVHAAARFLPQVQRVIFIGGGDSMLLHEILKYPHLKLVVGLELDQMVTRKSFQYFATQPHFDDPRVEWWFGDATKSLLLLPKDYWQSFDLVLVDLSETVMSLSVTEDLDVFDALALLLKPTGVMVKNELYFGQLSPVFNYAIQIVYECPVICDQVMVFGSQTVDFLHASLYDHGVPTLLYEPLITSSNRLDYLHDYRKNEIQARCANATTPGKVSVVESKKQTSSAGIMEVMDLEQIDIESGSSVAGILQDVILKNGFHPTQDPTVVDNSMIWILMKEGYVLARYWPTRRYISMDVNLWGRLDKLTTFRNDLASTLKSEIVSKFRVVVGGMYGSSSWTEDRAVIGPHTAPTRNCTNSTSERIRPSTENLQLVPSTQDLIKTAIESSIQKSVQSSGTVAVVLCGRTDESCWAADLLQEGLRHPPVSRVIRLQACSNLETAESMYDCERTMAIQWVEALGPTQDKTQLLVVDSKTPKKFLQIIDSLLSQRSFHRTVIATVNVAMAWSFQPNKNDDEGGDWRNNFLDYYRRHYKHDPLSRGELVMRDGDGNVVVEFGMVVCGNPQASYVLRDTEVALQQQLGSSISVSLDMIHGGKFPFLDPWHPKEFLQSDYDNQPGLDQYYGQDPLAHHVIFQLEPKSKSAGVQLSMESLKSAFQLALNRVDMDCAPFLDPATSIGTTTTSSSRLLGEGGVLVCLNSTVGTAVLTWDGRTHVDLSYYRIDDNGDSTTVTSGGSSRLDILKVTAAFQNTNPPLRLRVALQDEMPRGMGRTINPRSDLQTPEQVQVRLERLQSDFARRSNRPAMDDEEEEDDDDDDDEEEDDDEEYDSTREEL